MKTTKKTVFICLLTIALLAFSQAALAAPALFTHEVVREQGVDVVIPVVVNDDGSKAIEKINAALAENVKKYFDEFKKQSAELKASPDVSENLKKVLAFASTYSVTFNQNNLISVKNQYWSYTGGAHGIQSTDCVTADTKTGKIYKLADLFDSKADYKKILNGYITKQIDANENYKGNLTFEGVDKDTKFYITREFLFIYYNPYEIGAYVMGSPRFAIPMDEINDYFKEDIVMQIVLIGEPAVKDVIKAEKK